MTLRRISLTVLLVIGTWQLGSGLYLPAKAWLAQQLIKEAWRTTRKNGEDTRPWRWADTVPVARLSVPAHGEDLIVLSGVSGEALAFGPGHVTASGAPGSDGHAVIGAHRDTHFRFLQHVALGETMTLETRDGRSLDYVVDSIHVADSRSEPLVLAEHEPLLTLITCYPFDGLASYSPLRYVVTARPRVF